MITPKEDFQDVAYAVQELKKVLGDDDKIIRKLPLRRKRYPMDITGTLNGDDHNLTRLQGCSGRSVWSTDSVRSRM